MNFKEIIDKLQSVNIKDLKGVDLSEARDKLKSRPNVLIIIGLVLVTGTGVVLLYFNFMQRSMKIAQTTKTYKEQWESAKVSKTVKAKYDKFVADFPKKISIDDLIDKVSAFAIQQNVQIIAFSPAQEVSDDYTKISKINIDVSTESYGDLIQFMQNIEQSPYAIRVDSWQSKLESTPQSSKSDSRSRRSDDQELEKDIIEEKPAIRVTIELAVITLEDKKIVKEPVKKKDKKKVKKKDEKQDAQDKKI